MGLGVETRRDLIRWYRGQRRILPWRKKRDPYAIWISEIMLQQTQVVTVIPYFERFMRRFPDVYALANASESEVLALWSGLGYYRRAKLLHAGAKWLVQQHGGVMPRDARLLRKMPGIGRYTAGAISSIAWDAPEPIVDGNVVRVLCRWHNIQQAPDTPATVTQLWNLSEQWVKADGGVCAGDFNQALMELGATVCTKHSPRCDICPVSKSCAAYRSGKQLEVPKRRKRARIRRKTLHAWVFTPEPTLRAGCILWFKQAQGSLFSGLWNVPLIDTEHLDWVRVRRQLPAIQFAPKHIGQIKHVLTHRLLDVHVWTASGLSPRGIPQIVLASSQQQQKLPKSKLTAKILSVVFTVI